MPHRTDPRVTPPSLFPEPPAPDAPPPGSCQNCRQAAATTHYNLCKDCYTDEDVRYRCERRPYRRTPRTLDTKTTGLPPDEPTAARPQSAEKIAVLQARATACCQLHHPDDAYYLPLPVEGGNPADVRASDTAEGTVGHMPLPALQTGLFLLLCRLHGNLTEGIERSGKRWRLRPRDGVGNRAKSITYDSYEAAIRAARLHWEAEGREPVESGDEWLDAPLTMPRGPIHVTPSKGRVRKGRPRGLFG